MQTVLIVDDEQVMREGLRRILSSRGYRALTAQHGLEALEILKAERVDVILCDLKMPVMGAIGVLERVGADYQGLPVIIITGHGTQQDAAECVRMGAYAFVVKPFQIDDVLEAIKCAIEGLPPPVKTSELPF